MPVLYNTLQYSFSGYLAKYPPRYFIDKYSSVGTLKNSVNILENCHKCKINLRTSISTLLPESVAQLMHSKYEYFYYTKDCKE
jgi:uncharacterized protein with PIN domain